jgi:uncharacterized protein (TIGR03083 family)
MDENRSWQVIEQQRLAIAGLLAGLTPEQWEVPSLCAGWRVRDVAAHLTLVSLPPSPGSLLADLARARGSLHRMNTLASRRRAARPPDRLVADLRDSAGSRKLPVVSNRRNVLFDVLAHGQDIAIPLGLDLPVPVDAAADGATRVWEMGWPFWARRRLRGLRLTATDVDWSVGSGAEVRGPIRAQLLLVTGRTAAAAPMLTGDGLPRLTSTTA